MVTFQGAIDSLEGREQGDEDIDKKQQISDSLKKEQNVRGGVRHESCPIWGVHDGVDDQEHHEVVPEMFESRLWID